MSNVNINRKINDPFYRYKMPRILAKVEGRGNGIKTVVVNMSDVSKALQIPPAYPTKFMGIELGAQVILDQKNDRYIVNGSHDATKLQRILYEFIEKYILCPSCDNPETVISVLAKNGKIRLTCKACGSTSIVEHNHKLNTYVIKNPPPKEAKVAEKVETCHQANGMEDDFISNDPVNNGKETVVWLTDTSQAAVDERMASLSKRAAELVINDDMDKSLEERCQILRNFVSAAVMKNGATLDCALSILHESKRLDIGDEAAFVIGELIFTDSDICSKLATYRKLLPEFCKTTKSQLYLLASIEVAATKYPEIMSNSLVKIFKTLYDFDLVEEDTFLAWSQKRATKYLKDPALVRKYHDCAQPFINWLKTAEEESDEEEEEIVEFKCEEENIMNSQSRYGVPVLQNDDDLDIDAI